MKPSYPHKFFLSSASIRILTVMASLLSLGSLLRILWILVVGGWLVKSRGGPVGSSFSGWVDDRMFLALPDGISDKRFPKDLADLIR